MGILDQMEEDSRTINLPSDEELRKIGTLAQRQLQVEREIADLEETIKKKEAELEAIRDKQLPDLLLGKNISELKLKDGGKIKIQRLVFTSIKASERERCFEWMEKNGFGSLVKYKTEVNIGKGETEKKGELRAALEELGLEMTEKSEINPMTLKAFVTEQIDAGANLPEDLFSIHVVNRSKLS